MQKVYFRDICHEFNGYESKSCISISTSFLLRKIALVNLVVDQVCRQGKTAWGRSREQIPVLFTYAAGNNLYDSAQVGYRNIISDRVTLITASGWSDLDRPPADAVHIVFRWLLSIISRAEGGCQNTQWQRLGRSGRRMQQPTSRHNVINKSTTVISICCENEKNNDW